MYIMFRNKIKCDLEKIDKIYNFWRLVDEASKYKSLFLKLEFNNIDGLKKENILSLANLKSTPIRIIND
jgi:hypothetical protein